MRFQTENEVKQYIKEIEVGLTKKCFNKDKNAVVRLLFEEFEQWKSLRVEIGEILGYLLYDACQEIHHQEEVMNRLFVLYEKNGVDDEISRSLLLCMRNFLTNSNGLFKKFHQALFQMFMNEFKKSYDGVSTKGSNPRKIVVLLKGLATIVVEGGNVHLSNGIIRGGLVKKCKQLSSYGILVAPTPQAGDEKGSLTAISVRLSSLSLLSTLAKVNRKSMFGELKHLLPDIHATKKQTADTFSLITVFLKDPSPKCRLFAINTITQLIDDSRSYLSQAKYNPKTTFISFSQSLAMRIMELYDGLVKGLMVEKNVSIQGSLLQCISALIKNAPNQNLELDFTKILSTIKPLIHIQDPLVRQNSVNCIENLCGIENDKKIEEYLNQSSIYDDFLAILQQSTESDQMKEGTSNALCNIVYNYPESQRWKKLLAVVTHIIRSEESSVKNSSLRIIHSFTRNETEVSMWVEIINQVIVPTVKDGFHKLRSTSISIYSNLPFIAFSSFDGPLKALCIKHIFEASQDKQASVRASAYRSLGSFILFPLLYHDIAFLTKWIHQIRNTMIQGNESVNVKVRACWVLANICQVLEFVSWRESRLELISELCIVALNACNLIPKIRCNAVRGLGNISSWVSLELLHLPIYYNKFYSASKLNENFVVCTLEDALLTELVAGSKHKKKVKWNACYALGSLLNNKHFQKNTNQIVEVLCDALLNDPNCKVRTQAASAVRLTIRPYGNHFNLIFETILKSYSAIKKLDHREQKYIDKLKQEIGHTFLHMAMLKIDQPEEIKKFLISYSTTVLQLLQDLPHQLINREVKEFILSSLKLYEKEIKEKSVQFTNMMRILKIGLSPEGEEFNPFA